MAKGLNLKQIAFRIASHLRRMENDPLINNRDGKYRILPYFNANAFASGSRVFVQYVSFQGQTSLTKDQALSYMEWLDAGNVGKHYKVLD